MNNKKKATAKKATLVKKSIGQKTTIDFVTKTNLVKKHLIRHGHITSWTAIELYGATRLSAIIFGFRKNGMNISTVTQQSVDRFNRKVNYGKYIYHKAKQSAK